MSEEAASCPAASSFFFDVNYLKSSDAGISQKSDEWIYAAWLLPALGSGIVDDYDRCQCRNTEQGEILLRATLESEDKEMVNLRLSVSDTGSSISDADKAKLFHPFVQLGKHHQPHGTGLGLSICKRLVELMDGRIGVQSVAPIVALTARTMLGDRENCLDAGMDDYLTNPVILEQLCQLIQRWTALSAQH